MPIGCTCLTCPVDNASESGDWAYRCAAFNAEVGWEAGASQEGRDMAAVFFVAGFIFVLGAYIAFIAITSARLGPVISPRVYLAGERLIIGGILAGTALMFQPWTPAGLQWGFLLLLFS